MHTLQVHGASCLFTSIDDRQSKRGSKSTLPHPKYSFRDARTDRPTCACRHMAFAIRTVI